MATVAAYPIIKVSGSAHQRGRQYGEQARDRVAKCIEIYQNFFEGRANLGWEEAVQRARGFAESIQALEPSILEEMRGIADGSGFRLEEIVAVNCRTEILFAATDNPGNGRPSSELHECTSIAVPPASSTSGHTLVGKNWDWEVECQDSLVILQAEQDDGPSYVMIVEAGMVGRDGLNEHGIAVCGNMLRSTKDGRASGTPIPVIRRRILNSRRLDEALSVVLDANRAASGNYLLAHESGVIINFEASPEQVYTVYPENGLLTHSNHFVSVAAQAQGIDKCFLADSLYRDQRVRDLLEPSIGQIDVADIQQALQDHVGYPRSVCRHDDQEDTMASIASIVMDVTDRTVYVSSGPPCSNEYQQVTLPGLKVKAIQDQHSI